VGPYRQFGDLMIDAYGEPGEDYPISMENRHDRLPRISVEDVMRKVEIWQREYRPRYERAPGAIGRSGPNA
jgi:heptosyltransferase I